MESKWKNTSSPVPFGGGGAGGGGFNWNDRALLNNAERVTQLRKQLRYPGNPTGLHVPRSRGRLRAKGKWTSLLKVVFDGEGWAPPVKLDGAGLPGRHTNAQIAKIMTGLLPGWTHGACAGREYELMQWSNIGAAQCAFGFPNGTVFKTFMQAYQDALAGGTGAAIQLFPDAFIGNWYWTDKWLKPAVIRPLRTLPIRREVLRSIPKQLADPSVGKIQRRERTVDLETRPEKALYKRPAIEVAVNGGKGGGIITKPPRVVYHREVPTREKKAQWKINLGRIIGGYHVATEINDFFESLAEAIPGKPCSKEPGFFRALCVLEHWDEINVSQAVKNIIANEIEDQIVGRIVGQLGEVTKAGGPNTTQITTYLRHTMS